MTAPVLRGSFVFFGLMLIWHGVTVVTDVPAFMLPPPLTVAEALWSHRAELWHHTTVTGLEMILGLVFGVTFGAATALIMVLRPQLAPWMMPVLVVSQALPVFAIAPLLVLWLGFGLASKVAMAALIIFFPVTVAIHNGLSHTAKAWRDQARLMTGQPRLSYRQIRHLLLPAALPTIASGLRVAAAIVPIGAVVGEWVGSNAGLGHFMLLSNAKVQIDVMFAALFVLACLGLTLYAAIDHLMRHMTRHHKEM